jgi:hypothetical protein
MPVPRAFKTDESFLEKIAIGATGTRQTFTNLREQGHEPIELERGSMSFKIWKAIKIKRLRVPDILCIRCARRVESRAKTRLEVSMSHSLADPVRGWDANLADDDRVAFVYCEKTGSGPVDWSADPRVQYVQVKFLRQAWAAKQTRTEQAKGAQEGFEVRVTWPSALASAEGKVERVDADGIGYRSSGNGRSLHVSLNRGAIKLQPLVKIGDHVWPQQIIAGVVPATSSWPCPAGADPQTFVKLASSTSLADRYAAVKALRGSHDPKALEELRLRVADAKEHVYIRLDAAAALMRAGEPEGAKFFEEVLASEYLQERLEAVIVLSEVGTDQAESVLVNVLRDEGQNPEIRAGAAWALGEISARSSLPLLVASFKALDLVIKVEAARAIAKLARKYTADVVKALPSASPEERPGVAWALGKAGSFKPTDFLSALVDEDSRHWVSYIIGSQKRESMIGGIEEIRRKDPEVYFAVTVLWKIIESWVYELEEY